MIISSYIIQANVILIVNYDCKTFIVQATGFFKHNNLQKAKEGDETVFNCLNIVKITGSHACLVLCIETIDI